MIYHVEIFQLLNIFRWQKINKKKSKKRFFRQSPTSFIIVSAPLFVTYWFIGLSLCTNCRPKFNWTMPEIFASQKIFVCENWRKQGGNRSFLSFAHRVYELWRPFTSHALA